MKRFHNLSLYRIVATVLVLQFHVFFLIFPRDIPYETLLRTFMLGLTALSGFLAGKRKVGDVKGFYLSKATKILLPAVFCFAFMALWILIYYLFHLDGSNYFELFMGERAYNHAAMFVAGNYYYLIFFAVCILITPVLERKDKWANLIVALVLIYEIAQSLFMTIPMDSNILVLPYVFGYYVGAKKYKDYTDESEPFSIRTLMMLISGVILGLGMYIISHAVAFPEAYVYVLVQGALRGWGNFLVGTLGFFLVIYAFRFLNRFGKNPFFAFTDKISFVLFLMNHCFFLGGTSVVAWVEGIALQALLAYVVTIASSIALTYAYDLLSKGIDKLIHKEKAA